MPSVVLLGDLDAYRILGNYLPNESALLTKLFSGLVKGSRVDVGSVQNCPGRLADRIVA